MIRPLSLIAPLTVAAWLAGASLAAASPGLKLDFGCYRSGQQGTAMVTDFDPNSDVDVLVSGASIGKSQTDDQGDFSVDFQAPRLRNGAKRLRARVTAQDPQGLIAEDVFDIVPLTLSMKPAAPAWNRKVTFAMSGFVERSSLYEHITRNGKLVTTKVFGTPRAPCGSLTRVATALPLKKPAPGTYGLQFDFDAGYSKSASPAVRTTVRVPG